MKIRWNNDENKKRAKREADDNEETNRAAKILMEKLHLAVMQMDKCQREHQLITFHNHSTE